MHDRTSRSATKLVAGALCLAATAAWQPAAAQDVDFAGQNIEMIIPFGEGGGADTWARVILPFLAKHLPGEPTIIIRNVPGGGAVNGANRFQQTAEPDGLTLLTTSTSLNLAYALDPEDERFQFDPLKWKAFLASPLGAVVYCTTSLGADTAAELKEVSQTTEVRFPIQEVTSSDIRALLSMEMLGIKTSPVYGMDGGDAQLAFERGEVHCGRDTMAAYLQLVQPMVEEGKAFPLFSFGYADESNNVVADPAVPDMPIFPDVYEELTGEAPSGPEFDAWMAFFNIGIMNNKQFLLPEGTPDNIVAAYDAAAQAMVEDPEFQAAADSQLGGYDPLVGDAARASFEAALTISPEAQQWVADWLKRAYDVTL